MYTMESIESKKAETFAMTFGKESGAEELIAVMAASTTGTEGSNG